MDKNNSSYVYNILYLLDLKYFMIDIYLPIKKLFQIEFSR